MTFHIESIQGISAIADASNVPIEPSMAEKQLALAEAYVEHLHDRCARYERYINSDNPAVLTSDDWARLDHERTEYAIAWGKQ